MTSISEASQSRLVKELAKKRAENNKEQSKLIKDLEEKRNSEILVLGVSRLVKDLADKKALEEMFQENWKAADEDSKKEIETLILEVLGHPIEISKFILDLEQSRATVTIQPHSSF